MRKLLSPARAAVAGFALSVRGGPVALRTLLASLWGTKAPHPRGRLNYTISKSAPGVVLSAPDREIARRPEADPVELHRLVLEDVFSRVKDAFALHGACVSDRGRGVLISGPSGFGKTTLAIHLALRGFDFQSDDLVLLDRNRGTVEPVRRGVHLRTGSRALLPLEAREEARRAARHRGRAEWTVDPDRWLGRPGACRGVALVLLLRPAADLRRVRRMHSFDLVFARGRRRLPGALGAIEPLRAVRRSPDGTRWRVEADDPRPIHAWIEGRPEGLRAWAKAASAAPRFDVAPAVAPISRFQAAIELAQEMVNRGPRSRIAEAYAGREQEIPVDLAARLANARCYALVPGRLEETVRLVEELFRNAAISPRRPGRAAPR